MNKRLVWNFEINTDSPLQIYSTEDVEPSQARWESRFFWPDDQIITLNGLDDSLRELSRYQIKHREDIYFLLPKNDYNIKLRREQLFYKPILMKKTQVIGYGKKIKLEEQSPHDQLPGCDEKDVQALITRIHSQGKKIKVVKEALIYTFETTPTTKLELAWLHIANKAFFSVSIESHAMQLVESITRQLLGDLCACDYISFLKRT